MRHNWFKDTDSSFKVIGKDDTDISVWKFTLDDGLEELDTVTPSSIGSDGYYKTIIDTPDVDCFVLSIQSGNPSVIRVADPEVLTIAYIGTTGETIPYIQYDMSGDEMESGDMTEIGEGFYYVDPESLDDSFFVLDDSLIKNLHVPYLVTGSGDGDGGGDIDTVDQNFVNTGFNMLGFLGNRHSYFDLDQGKWIEDDDVEARAADLAKAVCYKYDLVWDDKDDDLWIGNYMKYIRTYQENDGKVRYYKVAKTPEDNVANFNLMQTDEDGNLVIRGISLLMLQTLETIDDTEGALIKFVGDA